MSTRSRATCAPALLAGIWLMSLGAAVVGDQSCLVDDLTLSGRWLPDQWNSAPGSVAVIADGPEEALAHKCLEVRTEWPTDGDFRFFSIQPQPSRGPIPYRLKEVGLWVRGVGDRHFLEVHFKDAKGVDAKIGFGALTFQGWRRLSQPIPVEVAQPLTLTGIIWHNWGLKGVGGSVVSAVARLEGVIDETKRLVPGEDGPELLMAAEGPCGLADDDGKCVVGISMLSWSKAPCKLVLDDELLTDGGVPLKRTQRDIDFAGEYAAQIVRQLPGYGCYRSAATLSGKGSAKPLARAEARLARVVPAAGGGAASAEERMRSSIGVNTHFGAPWEAFGRLGVHWARDYSWGWLGRGETAPVGNGRDFAAVWAEARKRGVIVLPTLQGAFRNKAETGFMEDSVAISAGFERLSKALPDIPFWEIDNEYELALRDKGFDMADYERALWAAAEGLRRVGSARVVPTGTAGIRYDMAKALLASDARDSIPIINSHFYTGTAPPETGISDANFGGEQRRTPLTALDQMRRISRLAHAAGKESWLTETGWDVTNGPAVGEARQAEYLPRVYLAARSCGVDKIFWFYDRDVPGGTGIFSTCGLIRLDGSLRPSAVAVAALSRETARARFAGTLDFGPDIWVTVLAQPEGGWTVAIWSVEKEHPLPEGFAGADAVDILGNPAKTRQVTPSILYFHFRQLPKAWDLQRQAMWESPTTLETSPGGTAEVRLTAPSAKVTWGTLPAGVTAVGWRKDGDRRVDTLRVAVTVPTGTYPLTVVSEGDGWRRSFAASLLVEPPLAVSGAMTYAPDEPQIETVTSTHLGGTVTARLAGDTGVVAPARFTLAPGRPRRIAVVPGPGATGPLTLELAMDNGAHQSVLLYPVRKVVPHLAALQPPGDPRAWPGVALCPCEALFSGGGPADASLRVGWTEAGLVVAAEMPAAFLTAGKPDSFWDFTNVELFVDPASEGGWSSSCRQLWFTPVKDGQALRVVCGLWDRLTNKGAISELRCKAAVTVSGNRFAIVATVPTEILGRPPKAGETWALAISAHGVCPAGTLDLGWPRRKAEGILAGPANWGLVKFE